MEEFQPYLSYLGLGVGLLIGAIALVWLFFAIRFFFGTRHLTQTLTKFFELIVQGDIDIAYEMTSPKFKGRTPKAKFKKFIKANKLNQYKRTTLPVPEIEGDRNILKLSVILSSGREVPLKVDIIKKGKDWQIDVLEKNRNV